MDIKFIVGENIKAARLKSGLSQEKLASLADIDRTYLPSIEKGKRNISITVLLRLANALEIDIKKLLKGI